MSVAWNKATEQLNAVSSRFFFHNWNFEPSVSTLSNAMLVGCFSGFYLNLNLKMPNCVWFVFAHWLELVYGHILSENDANISPVVYVHEKLTKVTTNQCPMQAHIKCERIPNACTNNGVEKFTLLENTYRSSVRGWVTIIIRLLTVISKPPNWHEITAASINAIIGSV